MNPADFARLLSRALEARGPLLEKLRAEGTDCYRLFHGIAEGLTGLTVDRYGPLLLAQTFRDPLSTSDAAALEAALNAAIPGDFHFAYNHRGKRPGESFDKWHRPEPNALGEFTCSEGGVKYLIRARHRGIDPWLFLDLRPGRRLLRAAAQGRSVLNLFAYTCGAGVCAAAGGAAEVWNVDFAGSSLEVGGRNAALNGIPPEKFRTIKEDCLTVVRQLAGLDVRGRFGKKRSYLRIEPRRFGLVFLDPPAWAKGPLAAVDIVRDYPALFKPALLALEPGGRIIATNHAAGVSWEDWEAALRRCADKAGRPLKSLERTEPDGDFPSFDGRPPLKIAVCGI
ncbi:MAG: class I SAM-dependent methyltransferase [Elusimicrobiales bacterium]|nr:class I SAM-dependent methyltransferase [Elusimicrobiales bacterium]